MYTLRRPLIVSELPLDEDIDLRIARLVGVPWSLHAFEWVSLVPAPFKPPALSAAVRSAAVMLERFAPHDRLVLLGADVCHAFACVLAPLAVIKVAGRGYLHLPNPWSDDSEAADALQMFLDGAEAPRCGVG